MILQYHCLSLCLCFERVMQSFVYCVGSPTIGNSWPAIEALPSSPHERATGWGSRTSTVRASVHHSTPLFGMQCHTVSAPLCDFNAHVSHCSALCCCSEFESDEKAAQPTILPPTLKSIQVGRGITFKLQIKILSLSASRA